jgi:hypothetical protein
MSREPGITDQDLALLQMLQQKQNQQVQQQGQAQGWSGPSLPGPAPQGTDQIYRGQTAGYQGPLRQSDVPSALMPMMGTPQQIRQEDQRGQARSEMEKQGGDAAKVAKMAFQLNQLGLNPRVQETLLEAAFPAIGKRKLEMQKELYKYRYDLENDNRSQKQKDTERRLALAEEKAQDMQDYRESLRRTPIKDVTKDLQDAFASGITDPQKLAAIANAQRWDYQGGTSSGNWLTGREFNPRVSVPASRSQQAAQPPAAPTAQPGQAPAKVTVEKGGKRYTLNVNELAQAQKEGYKLVR